MSILFIYVPQQPTTGAWHREGVQKHLLVTILLFLDVFPSSSLSRGPERGHGREGIREAETYLLFLPS